MMNNNFLLSLALTLLPILAIVFVGIVLIHKLYIKIRSRYPAKVNCWFCNYDTKVEFLEKNSWTCPQCEQYNGFNKDGDYNREIYEQLDCSKNSNKSFTHQQSGQAGLVSPPPSNGFCDACNEAQRLKVEKLAQFEPKNESRFDEELKAFKQKLEDQYKLCETCNRHLNKVLREKKRMIIGAKFLEFVLKGARKFQEPYLIKVRQHIHEIRKQRLNRLAMILTLIHFICLVKRAPIIKREQAVEILGESVGKIFFMGLSHVYAFGRVMIAYIETLLDFEFIEKCKLFMQTVVMMVTYSLGLRMPLYTDNSLSSLYMDAYPFILLVISFLHKVLDSLKLTRFTYTLISWSIIAGGLLDHVDFIEPSSVIFLNSLVTLILTMSMKYQQKPKLLDTSGKSFHKVYSEDYLSDDDTISMLSEKMNSSCGSVRSGYTSNQSFMRSNMAQQKSPLTSSTYSLNCFTGKRPSPNTSLQGCFHNEAPILPQNPVDNFDCDSSMYSFRHDLPSRANHHPLFGGGSTLDLRSSMSRPPSTLPLHPQQSNSFLNQSFNGCLRSDTALSSSFAFPRNALHPAAAQNTFQRAYSVAPSLHSPFSVSSNALYHQQERDRASNLLTPSRFSTNCLAPKGSNVNTWLTNNNNNNHYNTNNNHTNGNAFLMKDLEENLSRTSSHSSGFESQTGGNFGTSGLAGGSGLLAPNHNNNNSRENSCLPDMQDISQRNANLDSSTMNFRPVAPHLEPPLPSYNAEPHPTIAPSPFFSPASSTVYNSNSSVYQRKNPSSSLRDSFNLNKINEELPALRCGDLLRKWQESQKVS